MLVEGRCDHDRVIDGSGEVRTTRRGFLGRAASAVAASGVVVGGAGVAQAQSGSVSPPVMVSMTGGFYNAVTAFCDKINAPLASDIRVYTYTGSQWNYNKHLR